AAPRDLHSSPTRRSSDLASAFLRCVQFAFGLAPVLQLLAVRTPLLFPQLIGALSNDVLRNRHDVSFPGEMRKMNAASGTVFHRRSEEHTSELQSRENLVC